MQASNLIGIPKHSKLPLLTAVRSQRTAVAFSTCIYRNTKIEKKKKIVVPLDYVNFQNQFVL